MATGAIHSATARNRHTFWCFTYNYGGVSASGEAQPPREAVERFVDALCTKSNYCVGGYESAPNTGQLHLQGYCQLAKPYRLSELSKLPDGGTVHWEPSRSDEETNRNYCLGLCEKKGNQLNVDSFEFGELRIANPGAREKRRWDVALTSAKQGRFEDIDPQIMVCQFGNLHRIADQFAAKPVDLPPGTKMRWYWGDTGTGKSRTARAELAEMGAFYIKTHNKWWDHYVQGQNVLMDDLGLDVGKHLHDFLKQWADIYVFACEYKGGIRQLRPPLIIVTSNFHPYEIWGGTKDYDPIMRRLTLRYFSRNGESPPTYEAGFNLPDESSGDPGAQSLLGTCVRGGSMAAPIVVPETPCPSPLEEDDLENCVCE
jgi:hypothetical protein